MGTEIANPLADIIRRAATMPADGPASKLKLRMEDAGDDTFLLLDCSGSMNEPIGAHGLSKYEHLVIAVKDVSKAMPGLRLVCFGSRVREIDSVSEMPGPNDGGTDLAAALRALKKHKPRKSIIISDGLPTNAEGECEKAADSITGQIEAIYCGPDNHPAVLWLQSLCRATGGRAVAWTGRAELSNTMRQLLIEGPR